MIEEIKLYLKQIIKDKERIIRERQPLEYNMSNDLVEQILREDLGLFILILKKLEKHNNQDLQQEKKDLITRIDNTTKYVKSLSSKGRDCQIYWDIKQEILSKLKESDK